MCSEPSYGLFYANYTGKNANNLLHRMRIESESSTNMLGVHSTKSLQKSACTSRQHKCIIPNTITSKFVSVANLHIS